MLFFELFPALFVLVAFIIGIALFAMHHRARNDPADPPPEHTLVASHTTSML